MIYRTFSATLLVLLLMMKLVQAERWWEYLPDDREYRALIPAFCKVYVRKDQVVASPLGGYHYLSDCGCEYHVETVLSDCDGMYIFFIPRCCPYCGGFCQYYYG